MDFDLLHEQITMRLWRCNEMPRKQCEDYAYLAVHQVKQHMAARLAENALHTRNIETAHTLGVL